MKIGDWYRKRRFSYAWQRGKTLVSRYGLDEKQATERILYCVDKMATKGCAPTFPVPARVIEKHPHFFARLQARGAELAVHGYNHVDLKAYLPDQASRQLLRAVDVFNKHHIEVHGFRCPYLSCTDELLTAIPAGIFQYSSNQALRWEVDSIMPEVNSLVVNTIDRFYIPRAAQDTPCVPYKKGPLVEIPVCVPDDLQLFDGYRMPPEAIAALWQRLLEKTHRRGDLFNLMFHPELCASSSDLFLQVIEAAQALQPAVWITRLAEVADWWLEKETFGIEVSKQKKNLDIRFVCSPRATILVHGINLPTEVVGLWDARYSVLKTHSITLPDFPRPFIGVVGQNVPASTIQFLREQGYFVESGPFADQCSILLDSEILKFLPNPQAILDWIEDSPAPLVRYGRWPLECKSALCISGDLDALTLLDYADRLVAN